MEPGIVCCEHEELKMMDFDLLSRIRLSRRQLFIGAGMIPLSFAQSKAAEGRVTYLDALTNPDKIQDYISQIPLSPEARDILSVKLATPEVLEGLKQKYNFVPYLGTYVVTIPEEEGKLGNGTKSTVYFLPFSFDKMHKPNSPLHKRYPDLHDSMAIMMDSMVSNGAYTMAKHYSHGIPPYPVSQFKDSNGNFNDTLYKQVIKLLSLSSEYKGLLRKRKKSNKFADTYLSGVVMAGKITYQLLSHPSLTKDMDKTLIENLKRDFSLANLFPSPQNRTEA